jgi:hypothetical protein
LSGQKLSKIIKIKANIQKFEFFNGVNFTSIKAMKIITAEIKKPSYVSSEKMKK